MDASFMQPERHGSGIHAESTQRIRFGFWPPPAGQVTDVTEGTRIAADGGTAAGGGTAGLRRTAAGGRAARFTECWRGTSTTARSG
jgi:hypothetical protein